MSDVEAAVDAIRAGRLAIVPTDTVYGLAASAYSEGPVRRLYRAKGREEMQPTALVAANVDMLLECVPELRGRAALIARALLPGPLTLILPNPARRFAGSPAHGPTRSACACPRSRARRTSSCPVSARWSRRARTCRADPIRGRSTRFRRRSGQPPTRSSTAGALPGTPSTVIDFTGPEPVVLREGAVPPRKHSGSSGRCSSIESSRAEEEQAWPSPRKRLTSFAPPASPTSIRKSLRSSAVSSSGSARQIELIASENFTWPSVLEAVGSVPTNKYAEGYPGRRYYGGCEVVDEIEQLAIDRAKELFGAEHANVQPHAGAQANMAAYFALLQPGDTILGLRLDHGGHLTHGLKVNFSGRLYTIASYGVSRETDMVDYDEVLEVAKQHRPKLIVCGGSAYPRTVDTAEFRKIADEVDALLMCDMAHFSGLVAAGLHPNPVEHCDIVTSTTHKTLAGPRAGLRPLPRGARSGRRPRGLPGNAGRAADARDRGQGGVLQDRRAPRRSAPTRSRCARTPTRSRTS